MTSFLPVLLLVPGSIVLMCVGAIALTFVYGVGHVLLSAVRQLAGLSRASAPRTQPRPAPATNSRFAA